MTLEMFIEALAVVLAYVFGWRQSRAELRKDEQLQAELAAARGEGCYCCGKPAYEAPALCPVCVAKIEVFAEDDERGS